MSRGGLEGAEDGGEPNPKPRARRTPHAQLSVMMFGSATSLRLRKKDPNACVACPHRLHPAQCDEQSDASKALNPEDVLKQVYLKPTRDPRDPPVVHRCKHCFACRGAPAAAPNANATNNAYARFRQRIYDVMAKQAVGGTTAANVQGRNVADSVEVMRPVIRTRTKPIAETRWREERSLGEARSALLSRRQQQQQHVMLRLPERRTNVTHARIEAPDPEALLRRRQAARASLRANITSTREVACRHGRYLVTEQTLSREEVLDKAAALASSFASKGSMRRSPQRSPQSVLSRFPSSKASSKSAASARHPKRGGVCGVDGAPKPFRERLHAFLHACIMSPAAPYEAAHIVDCV